MTTVNETIDAKVEESTGAKKGREAAERFAAGFKKYSATLGEKVATTIVTTTVATVTAYVVKKHFLDD